VLTRQVELLKKSIYNGYIETPVKIMLIQEFLKVQQQAWTERQRVGTSHAIQFLRNSILADPQTNTNSYDAELKYTDCPPFREFDTEENPDKDDLDQWLKCIREDDMSHFSGDE